MADAENAETTPAAETPKEEEPESKDRSGPAVPPDDYVWPENLFIEMRDMAAVSFLVYAVGYVVDVARKTPLEGIEVTDENRVTLPNRELARSFAPGEVLEILEKNRPKLIEHYEEVFDENGTFWDLMIDNLKTMMGKFIVLILYFLVCFKLFYYYYYFFVCILYFTNQIIYFFSPFPRE